MLKYFASRYNNFLGLNFNLEKLYVLYSSNYP